MAFRLHRNIAINRLTLDNKHWLIGEIKEGRYTVDHVVERSNLKRKTLTSWLKRGKVKQAGRPFFISPEASRLVMNKITSSSNAVRKDAFLDIVNEAVQSVSGDHLTTSIDGPSNSTLKRFMKSNEILPVKAEITTTARIRATSEIRNQVSWAAVFQYILEKKKVHKTARKATFVITNVTCTYF